MTLTLPATHIGSIAHRLLSYDQAGNVLGVTQRGIFLSLTVGRTVFLSYEPYRGPLTINLMARPALFQSISSGAPVRCRRGCIEFSQPSATVLTHTAQCWAAPPSPTPDSISSRQFERLRALQSAPLSGEIAPHIAALARSLAAQDFPAVCAAAETLLGWGEGLTPAGDDILVGMLLALNRWGPRLFPHWNLPSLNETILQLAHRKTTMLSASLIECACQGQADERLIHALDAILTGDADLQRCANELAGWGHSSGQAALAGMALALAQARRERDSRRAQTNSIETG